jgi:hypothetical protein
LPDPAIARAARRRTFRGGASGEPAVLPGQGGESQLVQFASDEVEDLEMPPLKHRDEFPSLAPSEIAMLRTWIDHGAAWNRAQAGSTPP